jgi:hypothetical protein
MTDMVHLIEQGQIQLPARLDDLLQRVSSSEKKVRVKIGGYQQNRVQRRCRSRVAGGFSRFGLILVQP